MEIRGAIERLLKNKNFKHGMLYTMFSFVNNGISFILLLILARYLSPSDYGVLNLFTTFVSLLTILITLSTNSYIGTCFFRTNIETVRKVIFITLATATVMLVLISLLLLLFPSLAVKGVGVPIKYLWCGLIICYFQTFNTINLDIWRLEEKPMSYGLYGVSFAICNFILSLWFVVCLHQGWEGRVDSWLTLAAIYFIISIFFLIRRRYLTFSLPEIDLIKETFVFSIPLIPHVLSFWIKQGVDRYVINHFYNESIVGFFSFASNLASIIMIIGTAFNSTNSVHIFKRLSEGYHSVKTALQKQSKIMTLVFLIVAIGVSLIAYIIITFVLPKYYGSIPFILPLCIGAFFQCIYLLWVNYLFYYKNTKQLMYITISTAILQFILCIWVTRYSPLFTAYLSMAINALTFILVRHRAKFVLKHIPEK